MHGSDQKSVLFAILARNKAHVLPRFLDCVNNLDYDKKNITIYINTNNNQDETESILVSWAKENEHKYGRIVIDKHEIPHLAHQNPHEWDSRSFKVLGSIRNKSLQKTAEFGCDFYFVADCDNFLTPCTLKELVGKDKPIISPQLTPIPETTDLYSNFFFAADDRGYYRDHPTHYKILNREMKGTFKVDVVHCTYLIKSEYIDKLDYIDGSDDYEFIIFSRSARDNLVDQYICNEKDFGTNVHFHSKVTQEEEKQRLTEYFKVNS